MKVKDGDNAITMACGDTLAISIPIYFKDAVMSLEAANTLTIRNRPNMYKFIK